MKLWRNLTITAACGLLLLCATQASASECSGLGQGDVNGDGSLNVADLVMLVNTVIATDGRELCFVADSNCDGTLNVVDIVINVNQILAPNDKDGDKWGENSETSCGCSDSIEDLDFDGVFDGATVFPELVYHDGDGDGWPEQDDFTSRCGEDDYVPWFDMDGDGE